MASLVTRMKNDGMTTVYGLLANQEMDRQQYFPENFVASTTDDDFVGRFFAATGSPNQMQNTFGIGFYAAAQPLKEHEFYKVMQSVNPGFDPPLVAEGVWNG